MLFQQGQMYRLVSPFETDECAWMVVSEDRTQAAVLEMISLVQPNSAQPPLRLAGLDPDRTYEIGVRPQFLETERFGSMVRQAFPELEQVPELFPCEQGGMTASGSLLMYAGIPPPPALRRVRHWRPMCASCRISRTHLSAQSSSGINFFLTMNIVQISY